MARRTKVPAGQDPFAPIEGAVTAMLALVVASFVVGLVVVAGQRLTGGSGELQLFEFERHVCVSADAGPIGVESRDATPGHEAFPHTSARGSAATQSYQVCVDHASFGEQLAGSAGGLLSAGTFLGTGVLLRGLIGRARRQGLFTAPTAGATRRLGWFLVVMSVAVPVGSRLGTGVVVAAAVPDQRWWSQAASGFLPASLAVLLAGLGVLSFARILRLAVPLQEEAALTV